MGILSSLYTGITGLQGQGEALAIYGDNIANANTVGFKTSRPEFQDVIAKSLSEAEMDAVANYLAAQGVAK